MKSKITAGALALFLGGVGAHKFYLGKPIVGLLYLIFCWTFVPAFVAFIEAIMLFSMSDESFEKEYVSLADRYNAVTPRSHIICPDCRELIRKDASKCRFCGCALVVDSAEKREKEPEQANAKELLHKDSLEHAKSNNWGLYRNAIYELAELYKREGNDQEELNKLIMVNYIDANEPNNIGSPNPDPEIIKEFPLFDPKNAVFAPVPIERMFYLFEKIGFSNDSANDMFSKVVEKRRVPVMPLSPDEAWAAIRKYRSK